ncbi:MAG: hypothetical protein ACK506_17440 [Pirellula sp.]|jgi:hypothetical protein
MMNGIYERFIWPSLLFVWLRFRIRYNQISRGSQLTKVFALIGTIIVGMSIVSIWFAGFSLGFFLPRYISTEYYFLIWEGVVLLAMLMWLVHVLNEAQRGDPISLDKILHLPVSPSQAFVVNYLASLGTPVFLMTTGGCLGLVLGSVFSVGLISILFLLPMIAFLFAMTAATYWLQGWLATLMTNPRTKQLVLVLLPVFIIAATQIPVQLFLWLDRNQKATATAPDPRARPADAPPPPTLNAEKETLNQNTTTVEGNDSKPLTPTDANNAKENKHNSAVVESSDAAEMASKIDGQHASSTAEKEAPTNPDVAAAQQELDATEAARAEAAKAEEREKRKKERDARRAMLLDRALSYLKIANYAIPPLWGVAAIESLLNGFASSWKALFFTVALALVGVQFLRWSYRSTLAYWMGEIGLKRSKPKAAAKQPAIAETKIHADSHYAQATKTKSTHKRRLHEWSFPLVDEDVSATVAMTLTSMKRAPEVKMYLLMPIIAPIIILAFLRGKAIPESDYLKCLLVCGFAAFMLLMSCGVAGNTFGFDRAGFRTFVLSGMERWRVLLGKNLAHGTFVGLLLLPILVGVGMYLGINWYFGLCAILVVLTVLPMFALLMNLMAIYTPFPMGSGGIQPKNMDFMTVAVNLLLSSILPFILSLALIPLGIEWLVGYLAPNISWIPLAIPLSFGAIAGSIFSYRSLIGWQGKLLQSREKEILRIVTSKLE